MGKITPSYWHPEPEKIETLGDLLFHLRLKNQWSQQKLADELGVARFSIIRWEAGQHLPMKEEMARHIANLKGNTLSLEEVLALVKGEELEKNYIIEEGKIVEKNIVDGG